MLALGRVAVRSPKSNAYVATGVASGSLEPAASAVTQSGAVPDMGLTSKTTIGGLSSKVKEDTDARGSVAAGELTVFPESSGGDWDGASCGDGEAASVAETASRDNVSVSFAASLS